MKSSSAPRVEFDRVWKKFRRGLLHDSLRDFLPAEIITKTKHGFGMPFGRWVQSSEPLRQLAFESLADLKQRRIVRAEFIDRLTDVHIKNHADYYGTLVWILMMLEQWLKQHRISV